MANFIKKIVDRAKSRSVSPVKQQRNDFHWERRPCQQQSSQFGCEANDYDYFVHPEYNTQNFQSSALFCSNKVMKEDHRWNAHPFNTIPHYNASHQSDFICPNKEQIIPGELSSARDSTLDNHNETCESVSSPTNDFEHHFDVSVMNSKQNDFNSEKKHISQQRSVSPEKATQTSFDGSSKKSRSKSPFKRLQISETLNYLSPQCQFGKCSAALVVQDTKFLVCKHQLSHVSDYFRVLFSTDKSASTSEACQSSCNEFAVVVSSLKNPPPATQFKWFLESTVKNFIDITDDILETCMRLSKRFRAKHLELKCAKYIQDNVTKRTPVVALYWLNWVLKHKFDRITRDACLPCVAAASVQCLEEHRNLISERLLADLLATKLRTLYDQAVTVFQTIHSMDHFYVDVAKCPTCGYQSQQERVRIQASPCRKMIGCNKCLEFDCNLNGQDHKNLQACYQCEHGLIALNDHTADCQCQIPLIASHLKDLQHHFLPLGHPR